MKAISLAVAIYLAMLLALPVSGQLTNYAIGKFVSTDTHQGTNSIMRLNDDNV